MTRVAISLDELNDIRAEAMNFANIGLYRYRFSGEIVFMDRGTLRLLDLEQTFPDPDQVVGKEIGTLFHHVLPPGVLRQAMRQEGVVHGFEYHYRTLSGEERWVYHHAYLVDDASGEGAIQVICQDITALKQVERSLAASEARYRTLIEESLQGILVIRGTPPRVIFTNQPALAILGIPPEGLTDVSIEQALEHIHPDDRDAVTCRLGRLLSGGSPAVEGQDFRVFRADGTMRWVNALSRPIDYAEEPAIQTIVIDITERVEAETKRRLYDEEMEQAQRLESLGVMACGIAHDFNSILTAVLGHAELAKLKLPPGLNVAFHLDEIGHAAEQAAELCRQMMVYAGRGAGVSEQLELDRLVRETSQLLGVSVPKKVSFLVELPSVPLTIEGDPSQLRQVVINLITNAAEAIGDHKGLIRVNLASVDAPGASFKGVELGHQLRGGPYAALEVIDTGPGMDRATMTRIFEPFYSTKATGRGLGLSTVLGMVRANGGTLRVESEPGEETRFVAFFPISGATGSGECMSPYAHGAVLGGMVLLVDDEPAVRETAGMMLERLGFGVITASDGIEAVTLFEARRAEIDLVILDLSMPGLNGSEVYQRLRAAGSSTPVLFSSAYDSSQVAEALDRGDADFIQKPYRLAALQQKLVELLGRS